MQHKSESKTDFRVVIDRVKRRHISYLMFSLFPVLMLLFIIGCGGEPKYGEKAFCIVKEVDASDPSNVLLSGTVSIEDGQLTTEMPGAVFVVGVDKWVTPEGKKFEYRQILLRNSNSELVLAPPGTKLVIPKSMEILGRNYEVGEFKVPADSRMPQ